MRDELRKLANELRVLAEKNKTKKLTKCAQALRAAVALELLRRKVG